MNGNRHTGKAHAARVAAAVVVFVTLATSNRAFDEPLHALTAEAAATAAYEAMPKTWNAYGPAGGRIQGIEVVVTPYY